MLFILFFASDVVFASLEWVSSLVSLQTAILEKKIRKGDQPDRQTPPLPPPQPSELEPSGDDSKLSDPTDRSEDRLETDHSGKKHDSSSRIDESEKDHAEDTSKGEKVDDGEPRRVEGTRSAKLKIQAPHASPGSSTISGGMEWDWMRYQSFFYTVPYLHNSIGTYRIG